MSVKDLIDARRKVVEEQRQILTDHPHDEVPAEAQERYDKLETEFVTLDARVKQLEEQEQREADLAASEVRHGDKTPAPESRKEEKEESVADRDREKLRQLIAGEIRGADFAPEKRDLTAGTATDGAELVPTGFRAQLVEHLIDSARIVGNGATVLNTSDGADLQIPKTTSYSTATIIAEGGTITESDPQFDQVTLNSFKYAFITQVSSELLQDSAIDVVEFLARQGGRALGNGFGAHVATGTGTGQPNGIFTAASTGVTGAGTAIDEEEVIDLVHSVQEGYRTNASFVMADATLAEVRKLQDGQGAFYWQPSMQLGVPSTLVGFPVIVDANAPAIGSSNDSVLFGDLSAYYARLAGPARIERSDDFAFNVDLVSWRFIQRADGDLIDDNAVAVFTGA